MQVVVRDAEPAAAVALRPEEGVGRVQLLLELHDRGERGGRQRKADGAAAPAAPRVVGAAKAPSATVAVMEKLAAAPHAAEPVALYDFLVNATYAAALLTVDQTHNLQACLQKASPLAQWAQNQYHAMQDAATLEHSDLALLVAAVALIDNPLEIGRAHV